MAVVLVLGLAPISNSYAAASDDDQSSQNIEQQADSNSKSAAEGDSSGEEAANDGSTVADSESSEPSSLLKSDSAVVGDDSNDDAKESSSDGKAEDAASQSGESENSVDSEDNSGTYNPDADFVDISNNCTAEAEFFKDSEHKTPLGDTAITSSEKFYAQLKVAFKDKYRPTLSNPNVMYKFPSNIKVAEMGETDLMDGTTLAGKWYIKDVEEGGVTYSVAYFKYNESYLNSTVTHAYVNLDCELNGVNKGDDNSEAITFPGSSTTVTVNTKDGSVDGSKFGGDMSQQWNGPTYDQASNSYTWTIKVSPSAYATDLKITDTIGSNLSFVEDSFTLVDAKGNPVPGTCEATIDGQNASISLGDLSAGTYYVQYKTTVNSLPSADNTEISNVSNKATFTWGSKSENKKDLGEKSPQSSKYSMVSKSADGSSTPSAIKWVVKLNNGSIKADMGGYSFSDELGSDQAFNTSVGVTVTDSDGKTVTVTDASMSSSALSFKLPADAGEKEYTVTYYTQMTNQSSLETVKNTAVVTPPDSDHGPEGEGTGTFTPKDSGSYIAKSLTSDIDSSSYDGKASWKSEILFSDMVSSTDPSSIVFTDQFSNLPNNVKVSLDGDVTLKIDGGDALVEGTDYSIDKASGDQWANNKLFTITFKNTDTVKNLIAKSGAKVVVTYSTQTTQVDGAYPAGNYKNKSSVKTDKKSEISDEADYTIEKEVTPPAVIKNGNSSSWDAEYDWGDGTKGAWITDWTVYANRTSKDDGSAVIDLAAKDVTVTDTLPADSTVVSGSAKYKLMDKGGYNGSDESAIDPTIADGVTTFVVPTKDAKYTWGASMGTQVSVILTYQTATKGSLDSEGSITNTAQAESGSYEFPSGEGTVSFENKALSKTGSAVSGSSAREYTITVNENAYDLVSGSDTLTLVDDIDYRGELAASTISVKSPDGIDLLASGQASYELSKVAKDGNTHTRLTITVPDSMKIVVTYRVVPSGNAGDEMKDFSNSCELSGVKGSATGVTQTFNVATSSGGTGSESWGISLTKYDSSGKTALSGATFELWKVDLDASTAKDIVKEKVDTQTSDASGKVSFGNKENPLASNTLYYFVETAAPAGYEISYTGNTYVMLKSDATKDGYETAYNKAAALGFTPSSARSYSAFDELEKGSFNLEIEKKVEGAEAPADATFTFKAEATGKNAASAPTLSDVTVTTDIKGKKTYTGTFTGSLSDSMKDQTFYYKVSETASAAGGWTYDSGEYTATVQVVEQDGKLVGNVSYAKGDAAADKMSFTNTYKTTGTPVLHVKKTVNGGAADSKFKDKTFTFYVYNADQTGAKTGNPIQHVNVSAGQTAYVNGLGTYSASGTYRYVIQEASISDAGWMLANDVSVTVTATDNGEGSLDLSYEYSTHPADDDDAALFDNTYTEAISAKLQAKKILNGRDMSNDEFTLQLIDQNEGDHKGEVIDSKTTSASRDGVATTVDFDALSFDAPGTYTYGIQEQAGSLAHVEYDTSVYTAQVVVTKDDATGKLSAKVNYPKAGEQLDSAPTFNNTYTAPATGQFQLRAKKTVNRATPKAGENFTFTVMYESGYEGGQKVADMIKDATTDDSGVASFGTVSLGEEFYGQEFVLRIHETNQLSKEWTKASDVLATVSVGQPTGSEAPVVTVKYDKVEAQYASFDRGW
ncbi:MAG: FctA domain-containing protein [Coriobacteriia bacterium]|nr:FctA domain-containing protein [Coriobacteriia bacterium]